MRISDWSSDVCSSDLRDPRGDAGARQSGLVTISHGERARVREISARAAIHQVDMVAQLMLSTLPDALEHLQETRTFFERGMVRKAAELASAEDVAELRAIVRSEEHTYELQSLMRSTYAVFCLKYKTNISMNT